MWDLVKWMDIASQFATGGKKLVFTFFREWDFRYITRTVERRVSSFTGKYSLDRAGLCHAVEPFQFVLLFRL